MLAEKERVEKAAEAAAKARAEAEAERDAAHASGEEAQRQIAALADRLNSTERALGEAIDDVKRQEKAREEEAQRTKRQIEDLRRRAAEAEDREAELRQRDKVRTSRLVYLLRGLMLPLGVAVALFVALRWAQKEWARQTWPWLADWRVTLTVGAMLFILATWAAEWQGRSKSELSGWLVRRVVVSVHRLHLWVLGVIAATVIGTAAYEQIVGLFQTAQMSHSAPSREQRGDTSSGRN